MEIRIINASPSRLRSLLGDLAQGLDLKAGDTRITCETEEQVTAGRIVSEALLTKGFAGYAVDIETGKAHRRLEIFDPVEGQEQVLLFGPVAGGR